MLSKLYMLILISFLLILFCINATVAVFSNSYSVLFSLKNINSKFYATTHIFKHIIFESGIILNKDYRDTLEKLTTALSNEYNMNQKSIYCMIGNGKIYDMTEEGYMGLTKLNRSQIDFYKIKDPFNPEENLRAGISEMKEITQNSISRALYDDSESINKYIGTVTKCLNTL